MDKQTRYSHLQEIKRLIRQKIDETIDLNVEKKKDNSVVTEIDTYICSLVREKFLREIDVNYFSEEDQGSFSFPMIILDPIDGTKELIEKIGECAVSFGIYYSSDLNDERNFSWIFNPFTGMEISSETIELESREGLLNDRKMKVLVSRTEYSQKLFNENVNTEILPIGSIAYKLMLLAYGVGDAVISKKPKNIWDIMAGTHICHKRGIKFYLDKKALNELDETLYQPNMIWTKHDPKIFQI